jgi:hypothetical protein
MIQFRQWIVKRWKKAKASKGFQTVSTGVNTVVDWLRKLRLLIRAMLDVLSVRRELLLLATLYFLAIIILLLMMPGHLSDFPASWRTRLNYVAKKDLDANFRISEADLGRPAGFPGNWGWFLPDRNSLIGKYVKHPILSGESIDTPILQELPDPTAGDGFGLVVFPLDKQKNLCNVLNTGSYVDVTDNATDIVSGVRVSAIANPPGADLATQSCFAILEVDRRDEPKLVPDKLASLQLVIRDFKPVTVSLGESVICQIKAGAHVEVMRSELVFVPEARVRAIKTSSSGTGEKATAGCVVVLEVEHEKSQSSLWSQQGALHLVPRDFALIKFTGQKGPVCKLATGSLVNVLRDQQLVISGVRVHMIEGAPASATKKKVPPGKLQEDEKERSCSADIEVPYEKASLVPADQIANLHLESAQTK